MKMRWNALMTVGVLAVSSAVALPALAGSDEAVKPAEGMEIDPEFGVDSEAVAQQAQYGLWQGTVESITKNDDSTWQVVLTAGEHDGLVCNLPGAVKVWKASTGEVVNMDTLKVNDKLGVLLAANAPMTLSLPPQVSEVAGFVLLDNGSYAVSGVFDSTLTNAEAKLQLNIDEKTVVLDLEGSRQKYGADDLKNAELLVCYTNTTKSIPAQTTPSLVVVLHTGMDEETPAEVTMVGLRSTAEAAGYTVKWTANDQPIVLTKGDLTLTFTIDSDKVTMGETELSLSAPAKLEGNTTVIPSDFAEML